MPLLYEKRGAVAMLTLSRPQARNAWGEDYKMGSRNCCRVSRTIPRSALSC